MTPLPLVVPDTDDTRRRIIEALAWASGIHRDQIDDVVTAEACRAGHPYSTENTYINPLGRKVCRTCMTSSRARYEDRKAA